MSPSLGGYPQQQAPYQQYPDSQIYPQPPPQAQQQPVIKPKPTPAEDLLSTPLTIAIPSQVPDPAIPAPPIPPNPEKDALLQALGSMLYQHRIAAQERTSSTLPSLQAQRGAIEKSLAAMQQELQQLTNLSSALESNERILVDSMRRADEVMEEAKRRSVPGVDDVLVAPTVVGGQLYEVVAEERALGDAMFVLGRALDKGRLGLEGFLKVSLARLHPFRRYSLLCSPD